MTQTTAGFFPALVLSVFQTVFFTSVDVEGS